MSIVALAMIILQSSTTRRLSESMRGFPLIACSAPARKPTIGWPSCNDGSEVQQFYTFLQASRAGISRV